MATKAEDVLESSKRLSLPPGSASRRFSVKYWGTRGSVPAPGPQTLRYGGNTTCVEIRCDEQLFIIDGGTGVRLLGEYLIANPPSRIVFLMSHLHMDHVQGFLFFAPFLRPGTKIEFWSAVHNGMGIEAALKLLFLQPLFPITMEMLKADLKFHTIVPGDRLTFGDVTVKTTLLNHPGDAVGYRFEFDGRAFCHCSDWEHPADGSIDQRLVDHMRDADLVSIDAAYTDDEYEGRSGPARRGWGHATHTMAIRHADAARVRATLLTHHEPSRSDDQLDEITKTLSANRPDVRFACEGESFEVGMPVQELAPEWLDPKNPIEHGPS